MKYLLVNQISVLNNPLEVDMPLYKPSQTGKLVGWLCFIAYQLLRII